MHRRLHRLVIITSMCAPAIAGAQNIGSRFWYDLKHGVRDMFAVWASPVQGDGRDYLTAGLVLTGVGLSSLADEKVGDWARDHKGSALLTASKPFQASEDMLINAGSGHWIMRGATGMYLVGLISKSRGLRDAGMGCIAAEQAQALPRVLGVYKLVSRERPLVVEVVDGDSITRPGDPHAISAPGKNTWYDNSFWGGHVANFAACISFWTYRFHLSYAEPVLWLAVAGMGVARIADQAHWLSDQLLGTAVGIAAGKYVADRSLSRRRKGEAPDSAGSGQAGGMRGVMSRGNCCSRAIASEPCLAGRFAFSRPSTLR